jgi:hypothetical protein
MKIASSWCPLLNKWDTLLSQVYHEVNLSSDTITLSISPPQITPKTLLSPSSLNHRVTGLFLYPLNL